MASIEPTRSRMLNRALVALLLASAGVNLLQAERLSEARGPQPAPASAVGRAVPEIEGFTLEGRPVTYRLRDGLPTALYYFSPTCAWCQRNWENLNALTRGTTGRFRVLALTGARHVADTVATAHVEAEIIEGVPGPVLASLGFQTAPHLLVVSPAGVVAAEWLGAPTPRLERQIETAFGVLLPGISPAISRRLPPQ
jgi:hypothetical protein